MRSHDLAYGAVPTGTAQLGETKRPDTAGSNGSPQSRAGKKGREGTLSCLGTALPRFATWEHADANTFDGAGNE